MQNEVITQIPLNLILTSALMNHWSLKLWGMSGKTVYGQLCSSIAMHRNWAGWACWLCLPHIPQYLNHRMVWVAQDHVQTSFEDLCGWRLHILSGKPIPVLCNLHSKEMPLMFSQNLLGSSLCSLPHHGTGQNP